MNRLHLILLGLALGACGKPAAEPSPPAAAQAAQPAAAAPAVAAAVVAAEPAAAPEPVRHVKAAPRTPRPPRPPAPRLSLLVNGQGNEAQIVAGWPVVVRVDLSSLDGKPVTVDGGSSHWSAAVRFETADARAWPLTPAAAVPAPAALGDGVSSTHWWTMDAEASARLLRGDATLRAVLECAPAAGSAWRGVSTQETRVRVVDEPAPLPPGWAELRSELEIDVAYCRSGAAAALARAEAAAQAQPASWRLCALRGNLLASAGRNAEADTVLASALALWWRANPKGCEPPWELTAAREALAPGGTTR